MEHSTEMQEEQQAPLIFTEGPAPIIKTKNQIFTAWSIAFLGAVGILVGLCLYKPETYWEIMLFIPDGLYITFKITIISILFAVPIGFITGLGRLAKNRFINTIASIYVEIIRGIPL